MAKYKRGFGLFFSLYAKPIVEYYEKKVIPCFDMALCGWQCFEAKNNYRLTARCPLKFLPAKEFRTIKK